jgi:hypothetical protein
MNIESKYKTNLSGEYHAGINYCPDCGEFPSPLLANAIGIANAPIGDVIIIECPKCFTHWYFHIRDEEGKEGHYYYFKKFIEYGINPHFIEK